MPCHPHFPLMVFWSLKPPRSRQEEKAFPLDPIFFIYLYTFSMFVECTKHHQRKMRMTWH